jgi:exopolyphosphatase/guanosine-5'-triphosphate,3'-diphosphate pyrophosphatase
MIVQFNSGMDYKILYYEKIFVKIGSGISEGKISDEAIKRGNDAINYFNSICKEQNINSIQATGTSALRNAKNSTCITDLMHSLNWNLSIIDGKREAELIYKGILLDPSINISKTSLIMDIGGGSVEFIIFKNQDLLWSESFEVGAQRLKDKFHIEDPIGEINLKNLHYYLESKLESLFFAIKEFQPLALIGSSGTFETILEMLQSKVSKTENKISLNDFSSIYELLINSSQEERLQIKSLEKDRAEMIVVAVSLLNFILAKLEFKYFKVSHHALKEGLIFEELNNRKRNG